MKSISQKAKPLWI